MKNVKQLMQQAIADNVFPGAVLHVSKNDQCVFHDAFGFRNFLTGSPMTTDTFFDLASLTKPLATALAVMVLVQQNKVGLDQELSDVLPAFKKDAKAPIKIKHLLYHNSGLADYQAFYKKIEHLPQKNEKRLCANYWCKNHLCSPLAAGWFTAISAS